MSRASFAKAAALEYLEYDARLFRWLVAAGGATIGALLWLLPAKGLAFRILSRVHRSGGSATATSAIEHVLAAANRRERRGMPTGLWTFYDAHVSQTVYRPESRAIAVKPFERIPVAFVAQHLTVGQRAQVVE